MGMFEGGSENGKDYIRAAIDALAYSEDIDEASLVRRVYALAFSEYRRLSGISGTPCELLDRFFADGCGELADMTVLKSEDGAALDLTLLSVGDILVFDGESSSGILIYDGDDLVSLKNGGRAEKSYTEAKRLMLLRPSLVLDILEGLEWGKEKLTDAQIALLATAEAYFMRGYRAQYDDSRFTRVGGGEFRWQIGLRNPEDYTRDRWGYINCAAFTYELYRTALGFDLGSLYTTYNQMQHYSKYGFSENEPMYPFYYVPNHEADEEERARVEALFLDTLRVGDLAVVRRNNGGGHVLMYIGGGRFVHSTGASYNYKESFETHEPTVLVIGAREYLFEPSAKNYIFSESGFVTQLGVIRPLDKFSGEIPDNTRNRVKNMRGIFAEKLSSIKGACTARAGDEITFTFCLRNLSRDERRIDIRDTVPCGTAYLCGDFDKTGDSLRATVALAARESREISYTVCVLDACSGKICDTGATVGGVKHACAEIFVKKTLTAGEREELYRAREHFLGLKSELSGLGLVNAIYEKAGLTAPFVDTKIEDIEAELFVTEEFYVLREGGKYTEMIPSGLFGGMNLQTQNLYDESCKLSSDRVRLPRPHDVVVGDVILLKNLKDTEIYLYTGGDRLLNLTKGAEWDTLPLRERLEGLLAAYNYFVVLRASMK